MPILRPTLEIALSSPQLPAPIMLRSAHVPAQGLIKVTPDEYRASADGQAQRLQS